MFFINMFSHFAFTAGRNLYGDGRFWKLKLMVICVVMVCSFSPSLCLSFLLSLSFPSISHSCPLFSLSLFTFLSLSLNKQYHPKRSAGLRSSRSTTLNSDHYRVPLRVRFEYLCVAITCLLFRIFRYWRHPSVYLTMHFRNSRINLRLMRQCSSGSDMCQCSRQRTCIKGECHLSRPVAKSGTNSGGVVVRDGVLRSGILV